MANGFRLTLDTLAPTGSISTGTTEDKYTNKNFNLTIANDNADGKFMKFWFDGSATTSVAPSGVAWEDISEKGASFNEQTRFTIETAEGVYYYHLILMDNVNNESSVYHTSRIILDRAAPTVSGVWVADPDSGSKVITKSRTGNYFGFEFGAEGLASVVKATISCPDFAESVTLENPKSPVDSSKFEPKKTVSFTGADGNKTITVTIEDACGNTSSATGSIVLDTTLGDLTMTLYKADGETALPEKINYSDIKVGLVSAEPVVAYKLWEGNTEPTVWTEVTEGILNTKIAVALSSGDNTKTLYSRIKDAAGNITDPPVSKSVLVDYSAPVISISSDKEWIAGPDGSDTGTITSAILTLTHNEAIAGLREWSLKNGSTTIAGSPDNIPTTFALTKTSGQMSRGDNTFSFIVTDQAGNTATQQAVVKLDDQKPTCGIGTLNEWYNNWSNFTCAIINASDAGSGIANAYVWTDTSSSGTVVPEGTTSVAPEEFNSIPSNKIHGTPTSQSAPNYIHVQLLDKVGHVYYPTVAAFGFDNVAPTTCEANFSRSSYSSVDATVNVTAATDAASGVTQMKVTGDITQAGGVAPGNWFNFIGGLSDSVSVKLAANAASHLVETKEIQIYLKDAAGNESGILKTLSTELDQSAPSAKMTLRDASDSKYLPSVIKTPGFSAWIEGWDDGGTGEKASMYKLYGDFNYDEQSSTGITEEQAEWKELIYETSMTHMLIRNMFCTSGDGVKGIYLKVKDDAGNESEAVKKTFTYDTGVPAVSITTNPDYYIVSKLNSLRRNSSGEIKGKYANTTTFEFTPGETIQAYKVCAYKDLDNAKWKDAEKTSPRDPAEEEAIPTTGGSTTKATGVEISGARGVMIKGVDYENALVARGLVAGSTAEGAHVVVIYVQDLAGTWSELANFEI